MSEGKKIYHALDDPDYTDVYVDREEEQTRLTVNGKKIPFYYVHGGFASMKVKFSFCIPLEEWSGNFIQYLSPFPGPDEEMATMKMSGEDDWCGFALTYHHAFIETNMGSTQAFGKKKDNTITWKSSAQAAEYFRTYTMRRFGVRRPYGVVFGGSGGGYKTIACAENTDAWDGAVPYVIGSPVSLPNTICMHAEGQRVLRNCFDVILDNLEPGGSGNLYAGLTADEAEELCILTKMGIPPLAWYMEAYGNRDPGSLPVLIPGVRAKDPTYFSDFWTKPGYLGADPDSTASKDRIRMQVKIKEIHLPNVSASDPFQGNDVNDAWKKQLSSEEGVLIDVDKVPEGDNLYTDGLELILQTGNHKGTRIPIEKIVPHSDGSGTICPGNMPAGMSDLFTTIHPGDEAILDNSDMIAIQAYYRHQVPKDRSFHAWDQFRNPDGTPSLPQRETEMGYGFTGTGTVQDGDIQCPMMIVQSLADEYTCPWCADWYSQQVKKQGKSDKLRVYYQERSMHGPIAAAVNGQIHHYGGILRQCLLDMMAWISSGREPLNSTRYQYQEDGQITVPDSAETREGLQESVHLFVRRKNSVDLYRSAKVGIEEPVSLQAEISLPKDSGHVTGVRWQFCDSGEIMPQHPYPVEGTFTEENKDGYVRATAAITHQYMAPGTYFVSVLVQAQRQGEMDGYTQICNIGRVRVVVE